MFARHRPDAASSYRSVRHPHPRPSPVSPASQTGNRSRRTTIRNPPHAHPFHGPSRPKKRLGARPAVDNESRKIRTNEPLKKSRPAPRRNRPVLSHRPHPAVGTTIQIPARAPLTASEAPSVGNTTHVKPCKPFLPGHAHGASCPDTTRRHGKTGVRPSASSCRSDFMKKDLRSTDLCTRSADPHRTRTATTVPARKFLPSYRNRAAEPSPCRTNHFCLAIRTTTANGMRTAAAPST